jgi:DNA (cytosine-5)-methyltransferase 1
VTQPLVLSLFPGIGLLDRAFEEEGFCVVRGPDVLWGGDIHRFHPPRNRFDGVIGGPPCQEFSRLKNLNPKCVEKHGNLIPEFVRCVLEAQPEWYVMENVLEAPAPIVDGYSGHRQIVRDVWVGGDTQRKRAITFGRRPGLGRWLNIEQVALHRQDALPAVCASGATWVPVRRGGSGKTKRGHVYGDKSAAFFDRAKVAQGLPADFDLPGFTVREKVRAVGNGVPMAMGRAIAKAVRRAMYPETTEASA